MSVQNAYTGDFFADEWNGNWNYATFNLYGIDPSVVVFTTISLSWFTNVGGYGAEIVNIDSITFADGSTQSIGAPAFMTYQPSNVISILYSLKLSDNQGAASINFLGLESD